MKNQDTYNDSQLDCGVNSENSNENNVGCDCGSSCGPSVSFNTGNSTVKGKIMKFFFYAIIVTAIGLVLFSIFK